MSRVGKSIIAIPEKVTVEVQGSTLKTKGPLGELSMELRNDVAVKQEGNELTVENKNPTTGKYWGTTRALIAVLVTGVSTGFKKSLEIQGVGYKFEAVTPQKLTMALGFSHKVEMEIPKGIKVEFDEKNKNILYVSGIDKQLVGEFTAKIRENKLPEPYKGKGIRYSDEYVRRKAGKTGKAGK